MCATFITPSVTLIDQLPDFVSDLINPSVLNKSVQPSTYLYIFTCIYIYIYISTCIHIHNYLFSLIAYHLHVQYFAFEIFNDMIKSIHAHCWVLTTLFWPRACVRHDSKQSLTQRADLVNVWVHGPRYSSPKARICHLFLLQAWACSLYFLLSLTCYHSSYYKSPIY